MNSEPEMSFQTLGNKILAMGKEVYLPNNGWSFEMGL
jgi:ATP-dependent phosphoenolpyruvate carboxykinase